MLQILTHCGTTICFEKWAFNCGSASLVENVPAHSCFTKLVIFWSYFITKLVRFRRYVITNYVKFSVYKPTSRSHFHHILSLCWSYYHCQYWVSEPQNINLYNAPSPSLLVFCVFVHVFVCLCVCCNLEVNYWWAYKHNPLDKHLFSALHCVPQRGKTPKSFYLLRKLPTFGWPCLSEQYLQCLSQPLKDS